MTISIPRESREFIPITVTVDGQPVTANVKVSTTPYGARPTVWVDPVTLGGRIGVMTTPGEPGIILVWAQVTSSPEAPVVYCGAYQMT